ncbi:MAG: D-tyrosyl-tRNA(Tyr) deacylase [Clostridiaceae bacterium]|nr:D-tyrosyl-tRNA(Tyr) deacylase [Clostridiaceae bacterium]
MRAVVQRVSQSKVVVDGQTVGSIEKGLTVLLGIGKDDTSKDVAYLANKIVNLRIFEDENEKMNRSVLDEQGEILVISQFTLYGDCRKGNRPSFINAASPQDANKLYQEFVQVLKDNYPLKVETGVFQAMMHVEIHNEGPVTILVESK